MAMTLTAAKTYVAEVLGAQNDANMLDRALGSLKATYGKWNALHNWDFLLMDNITATTIASCIIDADGVTVTNGTAGALFGVNVGQGVTGTGIPASTTVSAVTETEKAGVTAFTLSASSTPATVIITFSKYIPLIASTDQYNLPADFVQPYTARLVSNARYLHLVKRREIDRKVPQQDTTGTPTHYSIYGHHSLDPTAQHTHLTVFRTPGETGDNIALRYYRAMNDACTSIDIPDDFLYTFLDDARVHLLQSKNAADARLPILREEVQIGINRAIAHDTEMEEEDLRLIPQSEAGAIRHPDFDSVGWWYF